MLNQKQKKRLLEIARGSIGNYLKTGKRIDLRGEDALLNEKLGAFVTLHLNGKLKGCIGNIVGKNPLYITIKDMAVEAATGDPRFQPLTIKELPRVDIEISVLSTLKKIKSVDEIELGKHGVLVRKGFNSGVFLPQVADETKWTKEEFLSNLCAHKAGLSPDAWHNKDLDIYIFSAEVFSEKELK